MVNSRLALPLALLISAGCSSTTEIKSFPPGALVYVDGQLKGETPYDYGDRGVSGTTHKIRLEREGFKPLEAQVKKNRFKPGRVITFFWLPNLFYWFGYPDEYLFKLDKMAGVELMEGQLQQEKPPAQAQASGSLSKGELQELVKAAVEGTASALKKPPEAPSFHSDVDKPNYSLAERPEDFALVVGIEKYSDLPDAQFAERDAEAVKNHLIALGLPSRNVVLLSGEKAGYKSVEKLLETWLPRNVGENSRVFFYFSGHGAPDMKTGLAYLVPWDGDAGFLENTGYPVKRLYANLNALKAKQIIVALDACFSGAGGRSVLAQGTRPLVTQVDAGTVPPGKMTVFAAAAGNEITSTMQDQGHGTFTYYFLKGLGGAAKDASGKVTAQGLQDYLKPKVQDAARRQNREQNPVLQGLPQDQEIIRFQ